MLQLPPPPACAFASDNAAGAHPTVLDALVRANTGHALAYGADPGGYVPAGAPIPDAAYAPAGQPYSAAAGNYAVAVKATGPVALTGAPVSEPWTPVACSTSAPGPAGLIPPVLPNPLQSGIDHVVLVGGMTRMPKVIEAVESVLDLPDDALDRTRKSLWENGNLSSVSVLDVLSANLAAPPAEGELGMMIAMGPGFCSELVLLGW